MQAEMALCVKKERFFRTALQRVKSLLTRRRAKMQLAVGCILTHL